MKEIILETRTPLTPLEVLDWFYDLGFTPFDVRILHRPDGKASTRFIYLVDVVDSVADRMVSQANGQPLRGFPAVVRRARPPRKRPGSG